MCTNKNIQELLPAYLEKALDQDERSRVELHLSACEDCRSEIALLRVLAAEPVPDPGEAFWAAMPGRVYRQVRQQQDAGTPGLRERLIEGFRLPRPAWAAAALLLVTIAAWSLLPRGQDRPASPDTTARLSDNGRTAMDPFDAGQLELEDLDGTELKSLESWASRELAALAEQASNLPLNVQERSVDDSIADLNAQELERLSRKLDEYQKEG